LGPTQFDPNRAALRNETCATGPDGKTSPGCPPVLLLPTGQDWLHTNSLQYIAADKSILLSVRDQDWAVKIDYNDGNGSGNVLWRLGKDGDFTYQGTSDPYPWFSAQHDVAFEDAETDARMMSVFDNGNSRYQQQGGDSRHQLLNVDEATKTVTLAFNGDLG